MTVDKMLERALELLRANPDLQDQHTNLPGCCDDPNCSICPWVKEVEEFLSQAEKANPFNPCSSCLQNLSMQLRLGRLVQCRLNGLVEARTGTCDQWEVSNGTRTS